MSSEDTYRVREEDGHLIIGDEIAIRVFGFESSEELTTKAANAIFDPDGPPAAIYESEEQAVTIQIERKEGVIDE